MIPLTIVHSVIFGSSYFVLLTYIFLYENLENSNLLNDHISFYDMVFLAPEFRGLSQIQ